MAYSAEQASELAVRVLIALAERPEDLARFMDMAGLQPQELRNLARRPDIAVFLLDYVVEDDARLCDFAGAMNLRAQDIMAARTALSGPGSYGWEAS